MRIDSLSDLPQKYQEQAMIQCAEQKGKKIAAEKKKENKFHNQPVVTVNHHFDSRKEERRFYELLVLLRAGEIWELKLQEDFTLQEAFTDPDGRRIRAIRYRADFTYKRMGSDGKVEKVVEDVKSRATRTKDYIIKKKLMKERLGIDIIEV